MADGLLMLDRDQIVVSCNPALAMMLGMRRQEIVGQLATHPDTDPRLRAICAPATVKERTGVLAHEVDIPRDGARPRTLRVFATPVSDEDSLQIGEVRVVHDVTKEREIEEVKDEFFSTISHELRTPLFSIQGFVRILLEDNPPDAETQRDFLQIVNRQTEQLVQLVNNILNISRLESGMLDMEHKSVQMLDVLQRATRKLQSIAKGKNIRLETELPTSLHPIVGDRGWLEQVAVNLIGNGIKFTPEGGQVTVSAHQTDDQVLVEVRDTGIGIPPESLDRVFVKFYRVPDETGKRPEGTGLGLHIAKKIVEAHGGHIEVESNVGEGSVFRFALPRN
jgi:two-component system phosphate regulon sensor histidine kinase PhoR